MEEKYRSVKRSNAAFHRRLGGVPGGHELMLAAGFDVVNRDGEEYYALEASESRWTGLVAAREKVASVLAEANRTSGAPAAAGVGATGPVPGAFGGGGLGAAGSAFSGMPGGMPGMPSMPGGMPSPDQMAQVQRMMQDPQVRGGEFDTKRRFRMEDATLRCISDNSELPGSPYHLSPPAPSQ